MIAGEVGSCSDNLDYEASLHFTIGGLKKQIEDLTTSRPEVLYEAAEPHKQSSN